MIIFCKNCSVEFDAKPSEVNRGNAKFCSKSCASSFKAKHRKPKEPNVSCALCSESFYLSPSKLKASKSGLVFCCRDHKDKAQRIGGIKEIMPPHYGSAFGMYGYRAKAYKELPVECFDCKWSEIPEVLTVHHIDYDRANNDIANLMILCGRCHDIRHFLTKTGKWTNQSE